MAEHYAVRVESGVPVPMRDGTVLRADVYRPDTEGRFPVILERTPYNREERRGNHYVTPVHVAQRGYAVVIQDCRGRHGSEGEFSPFHQEPQDGYDTLEWCAQQPWSSGKVGTYGASYVGATQWLAAMRQHPALACIAPTVTSDDYYEGWTYQGGAFQLGFAGSWALNALTLVNRPHLERAGRFSAEDKERLAKAIDALPDSLGDGAPAAMPHLREDQTPYYFEWMRHPTLDDYWRNVRIAEHHERIDLPALHVGGWFDIFLGGTLRNFVGMREHAPSEAARSAQRLIIGPWSHTTLGAAVTGIQHFGLAATLFAIDLQSEHMRWWDRWLKGERNGVDDDAPVRLYVMGDNAWRDEQEWPLARTRYVDYYFHSGGGANTSGGDGTLSTEPARDEAADRFEYDPTNPVPTNGGGLCCYPARLPGGPFDHTEIEQRPDVLCYTTAPLEEDVEVTGPISVTLYASTDGADTDFTAKLVDVCEKGDCAAGLTDGIIRARYREGTDSARFVTPGEVYEYVIDLWATSNVFKKGHAIRVEVSSSNFPRFDRNPNTGEEPSTASTWRRASQRVLHDAAHPSRITLPVIPR